jgi:hypothetical protein
VSEDDDLDGVSGVDVALGGRLEGVDQDRGDLLSGLWDVLLFLVVL